MPFRALDRALDRRKKHSFPGRRAFGAEVGVGAESMGWPSINAYLLNFLVRNFMLDLIAVVRKDL